ncbi:hypothetical protein Purlil1_2207 [Purpureocillium lilacinum]|uniref:N-acetyltransferase domain-containing protein n=1 Tax=Purpureocillium lilacinum TaxID=33203 RepID=A0ABR0CA54_PURLI|nr:hypothetical protein Purlil1_2207 [Purpureocillium lilacinum]
MLIPVSPRGSSALGGSPRIERAHATRVARAQRLGTAGDESRRVDGGMAMLDSGYEYTERQHGSPREGRGTREDDRWMDGWMTGGRVDEFIKGGEWELGPSAAGSQARGFRQASRAATRLPIAHSAGKVVPAVKQSSPDGAVLGRLSPATLRPRRLARVRGGYSRRTALEIATSAQALGCPSTTLLLSITSRFGFLPGQRARSDFKGGLYLSASVAAVVVVVAAVVVVAVIGTCSQGAPTAAPPGEARTRGVNKRTMGIKIRPATVHDVPAVARLVLAALADESPWRAFVPRKAQARADLVEYAEAALRSLVRPAANPGHVGVCLLVLELSGADVGCRDGGPLVVAAVAWDAPAPDALVRPSRMSGVEDDTTHLFATTTANSASYDESADADAPGSVAGLVQAMSKGRAQRFLGHDPCLYLRLLATRPDYQRRGYGKVLAAKAVEFARQQHLSVCLQSAARGYILFSGLGFSDLGPVTLPADAKSGEDLMLKAMMLSQERVQRRGSWMESLFRYVSR